jgi:hypothetical protein
MCITAAGPLAEVLCGSTSWDDFYGLDFHFSADAEEIWQQLEVMYHDDLECHNAEWELISEAEKILRTQWPTVVALAHSLLQKNICPEKRL